MDLFEQVQHAFEGYVPKKYTRQLDDGTTKDIEWKYPWLNWWIALSYHRASLTAIQLLAVILLEARQRQHIDPDREETIVEQWANALRIAVAQGTLTARDSDSSLRLEQLPDGWDWCVSAADADAWFAAQGMAWTCREILGHLHRSIVNAREAAMQQPPEYDDQPVGEPNAGEKAEVTGISAKDIEWILKAQAKAQEIGMRKWKAGIRQITARVISREVAKELSTDAATHGRLGERGEDNVRTVGLKGWKFVPPPTEVT